MKARGTNIKLVYLAPSDIQVARVDRQCIVYFCSALAGIGVEVELIAMRIRLMPGEMEAADPIELYRVRNRFGVRSIPVPVKQTSNDRWIGLNRLAVHATEAVRAMAKRTSDKQLVFYVKNYSSAFMLLFARRLVRNRAISVFEAHLPPRSAFQRFVLKKSDRVIANSFALADELRQRSFVTSGTVLGIHQGVDLDLFDELRVPRGEARKRTGLPLDKRLVVYTGKIHVGQGEIDYILSAARALEDDPAIEFVLVGGRADHVSALRQRATLEGRDNVRFVGFVPPRDVHEYQFAADVLLLYYESGMDVEPYLSPGKLFEYMAAGRPIISVDLPVLREILGNEPAAALVPADAPESLGREIRSLLGDPDRAERLARTALQRVAQFGWVPRAESVIEFIATGRAPHGGE